MLRFPEPEPELSHSGDIGFRERYFPFPGGTRNEKKSIALDSAVMRDTAREDVNLETGEAGHEPSKEIGDVHLSDFDTERNRLYTTQLRIAVSFRSATTILNI